MAVINIPKLKHSINKLAVIYGASLGEICSKEKNFKTPKRQNAKNAKNAKEDENFDFLV